jgi:hypothetical protein
VLCALCGKISFSSRKDVLESLCSRKHLEENSVLTLARRKKAFLSEEGSPFFWGLKEAAAWAPPQQQLLLLLTLLFAEDAGVPLAFCAFFGCSRQSRALRELGE